MWMRMLSQSAVPAMLQRVQHYWSTPAKVVGRSWVGRHEDADPHQLVVVVVVSVHDFPLEDVQVQVLMSLHLPRGNRVARCECERDGGTLASVCRDWKAYCYVVLFLKQRLRFHRCCYASRQTRHESETWVVQLAWDHPGQGNRHMTLPFHQGVMVAEVVHHLEEDAEMPSSSHGLRVVMCPGVMVGVGVGLLLVSGEEAVAVTDPNDFVLHPRLALFLARDGPVLHSDSVLAKWAA
jgi:hypothetical protein